MKCEIFPGVYLIGSGRFRYTHAMNCNVYAVVGETEVALIDTGCGFDVAGLIDSLAYNGVDPTSVSLALLTHSDWDHARGARALKRETTCQLAVHADGRHVLEEGPWSAAEATEAGHIPFEAVEVDFELSDGDLIDLGGRKLQVIHTPGHSPDSVCFELRYNGMTILFSGDTVHAGGKHGIVTAATDFAAYRNSVARLALRDIDALLPGHGMFVLNGAGEQIDFLESKLGGKWVDVAAAPYPAPFESGVWYVREHPELLSET